MNLVVWTVINLYHMFLNMQVLHFLVCAQLSVKDDNEVLLYKEMYLFDFYCSRVPVYYQ